MRSACSAALKRLFHDDMLETKAALGLSNAKIAERLFMDPRSFAELMNGKSMASSLTFVLYLTNVCPDPARFLARICREFSALDHPLIKVSPAFLLILDAISKHTAQTVGRIRVFHGDDAFPVCPGCTATLEREYQHYCDRCGQALDWENYVYASVERIS